VSPSTDPIPADTRRVAKPWVPRSLQSWRWEQGRWEQGRWAAGGGSLAGLTVLPGCSWGVPVLSS